jgi:hypothetical protein
MERRLMLRNALTRVVIDSTIHYDHSSGMNSNVRFLWVSAEHIMGIHSFQTAFCRPSCSLLASEGRRELSFRRHLLHRNEEGTCLAMGKARALVFSLA